eukprot:762539-Hanusia_phi.AAC.10
MIDIAKLSALGGSDPWVIRQLIMESTMLHNYSQLVDQQQRFERAMKCPMDSNVANATIKLGVRSEQGVFDLLAMKDSLHDRGEQQLSFNEVLFEYAYCTCKLEACARMMLHAANDKIIDGYVRVMRLYKEGKLYQHVLKRGRLQSRGAQGDRVITVLREEEYLPHIREMIKMTIRVIFFHIRDTDLAKHIALLLLE